MAARSSARTAGAVTYRGGVPVSVRGIFDITVTIPMDTTPDDYVLQINGLDLASQMRSINMSLTVEDSPASLVARSATKKVFFKEGTATFTPNGISRLMRIVRSIPKNATNVKLFVTGASGGMDDLRANQELALKRADMLLRFMKAKGVSGRFTITLKTSVDFSGSKTSGLSDQAGQLPRSAVTASFEVPSLRK